MKYRNHKCNQCGRIFCCEPCPKNHGRGGEPVYCSDDCAERAKEEVLRMPMFNPAYRTTGTEDTIRRARGGRMGGPNYGRNH